MGYLDELAPFGDAEFDLMKEHIQRVMHSSSKSDWRTPLELFDALDREFAFGVDVAANEANRLCDTWYGPGAASYGRPANALGVDWTDARPYFMNPPYQRGNKALGIESEPLMPWVEKAWNGSIKGATVVGVLPFNPQTVWYRAWVMGIGAESLWLGHAASEVRMLPHRVTFLRPDGTPADNAPGNTCIVVWRPNPGYVGPWQPAMRYWSYR